MAKFDKKLHALLVKRGAVEAAVADQALADAQGNAKGFCELLLERKAIRETDLIGCVAQEMNLAPIDLRRLEPDPGVLEELPQDLAKYYGVVPVDRIGKILTVAVANPFDIVKLDDIEIVTGCELRPVVSSEGTIRETIDRIYNPGEKEMNQLFDQMGDASVELKEKEVEEEIDLSAITTNDDSSPVVKLVNMIIYQALQRRASDIHIEPFEKAVRVRYRTDGQLAEVMEPPKRMQNALASRIKVMADLDIAEHNRPQDGKFQLRIDGRQVDFRVSILPTVHGEKTVMRILDSSNITLGLDQLGFETKALEDFRWAVAQPYGMVLVTGPTGSGKSTTLYSALKEVMTDTENIVTVEDPVEYQLHGINQVPVSAKRGLTFAAALRSILRQDPDTIMIGEIRDHETIDIAIKAALTGHMVLSTLHTNDAPGTISRMVDMGVDPFLIASATLLVSAQRLLKKLCEECKEPYEVPRERLLAVGYTPQEAEGTNALRRPVGCKRCTQGYRGRFAILETMKIDEDLRRLIIKGASAVDLRAKALEHGMLSLRRCSLLNALRGKTSIEEALSMTLAD